MSIEDSPRHKSRPGECGTMGPLAHEISYSSATQIFREDGFGFRVQLGHKFGGVGRIAKTCVLTRPDCHKLQGSLSGSGCRNRLGQSMLHRKWQRRTAHMSEFVHSVCPSFLSGGIPHMWNRTLVMQVFREEAIGGRGIQRGRQLAPLESWCQQG